MKRGFKLLIAGLVLALGAASRHPDRMPTWDLVKLVSFNRGDASDMAAGSFRQAGTLTNGAAISSRVLALDGSNDFLSYPDAAFLSFTNGSGTDNPFSVSIWLNPSSVSGTYRFLVSKATGVGGNYEWGLASMTSFSGSQGVALVLYSNTAAAQIGRLQSTRTFSTSTWYHLVGTYSGNEATSGIKLYINGERVDTTNYTSGSYTGMSNTSAILRVGQFDNTFNYAGSVDDLRIYNRELTAAEVGAIYSAGRD